MIKWYSKKTVTETAPGEKIDAYLIHVNGLETFTSREDYGMVLVFWFSFT